MQRQDRNGSAVVHIAQDVMYVASGGFVVMHGLPGIRFRHRELRYLIGP
jgi:hypothetical protein